MIGSVNTPLSLLSTIDYQIGFTIQSYFEAEKMTGPVVCIVNGEPVLRKDWGRTLTPQDRIAFFIIPRGGDGFKQVLGVLITLGLTIAGFIIAGPLGASIGSAIGGIISVLIQPKMGKGADAASPTYSIDAQGNAARLLSPIPKGYGRHIMYPDFAAQAYTTFEGNDQHLYQLFCLGLGQYVVQEIRIGETTLWQAATGYSDSFEEVQIEIVPPGTQVTLFPAAVQVSADVGGADLEPDGLGPFPVNGAGSVVNQIAFDFVFPGGLLRTNDKGKVKSRTVQILNEARLIDETGTPAGAWMTLGSPSYTRSTATAQRFTENYTVPAGRYEARSTRMTPLATDDPQISDKVQWTGLRGFEPSFNVYPDVTLLAVKIKATNQLSQTTSRLFNVIQTAKLPIWDGTAWSLPQPTRSIAWAAADMLRNPAYGEGRADSLIDLQKLLQLDAIWQARGDTFNGVFDTKRTFWEALNMTLAAGRTQPTLVGGVCTFMRDQPRAIAKGFFTPANIRAGTFETEHLLYDDSSADDIIVEYLDERTWKTSEVQCTLDGSSSENPVRTNLFGVTSYAQAWREGMYQAASNSYRRIVGGLTSEMEGKLLSRGDAVMVSHDMPAWGASGEVEDYDPSVRKVYMSEPAKWEDGPFKMSFSDRRGRHWGPVVVTRGDYDDEAVIDAASLASVESQMGTFSDILITDMNKIPTRYAHGSTTKFAKRFIVTGVRPQGFDSIPITLINDDPRVYLADNGSPPDENMGEGPGITPDAPEVTGAKLVLDPTASVEGSVVFAASWDAAPGAELYVGQISYDGASWETVYEGTNTATTFVAQANTIIFRVAAIGLLRGPWNYYSEDFSEATMVPLPVTNLRVYVGTNNAQVTAYWSPTLRATTYRYEIEVEGYTVVAGETANYSFILTSATITQAGGPWTDFIVRLYALNSVGAAEPDVFTFGGASVVTAPLNLTVSNATPAVISVQGPSDNTWSYIRLYKGATDSFAAAAQIGPDLMGGLGQVFTFNDTVAAGTSRYFAKAFNIADAASIVVGPVLSGQSVPGGGGGGGGGDDGGGGGSTPRCVVDSTPILMANDDHTGPGELKLAKFVEEGDWVWTQHEDTLEWGAFRVLAVKFALKPIMTAPSYPDATPDHRFWMGERWERMDRIGKPKGLDRVIKMTVEEAHTYISVAPDGTQVLSHNIKFENTVNV